MGSIKSCCSLCSCNEKEHKEKELLIRVESANGYKTIHCVLPQEISNPKQVNLSVIEGEKADISFMEMHNIEGRNNEIYRNKVEVNSNNRESAVGSQKLNERKAGIVNEDIKEEIEERRSLSSMENVNVIKERIAGDTYYLNGEILGYITCSLDRILGLWNKDFLEPISAFKSPEAYTHIIQLQNSQIAGGKENGRIDILSLPSLQILGTLYDESKCSGKYISALVQTEEWEIVSTGAAMEGQLLVWDINTLKVIKVLTSGHTSSVNVLKVYMSYIFSGGNDALLMWDLHSKQLLNTINYSHPILHIIQINTQNTQTIYPNLLILTSGKVDQLHYLGEIEEKVLRIDKRYLTVCYPVSENIVILGDKHGGLFKYDINRQKLLEEWNIHNGRVSSIDDGGPGRVVTASWDETFQRVDLQGKILASNSEHFKPINHILTVYK